MVNTVHVVEQFLNTSFGSFGLRIDTIITSVQFFQQRRTLFLQFTLVT